MSEQSWHMAALALKLLAIDPKGLSGAIIKMRASPDREAIISNFAANLPLRKIPLTISDDQLLGGIDLTTALTTSQIIRKGGFFEKTGMTIIPMAERCPSELAAKLAILIDKSQTHGFLALDEGVEDDEHLSLALADRFAFYIEPIGRCPQSWVDIKFEETSPPVTLSEAIVQLTILAAKFGIFSLRAPTLALCAARAHAKLTGHAILSQKDIEVAATLVYPQRATVIPQEEPEQAAKSEEEVNPERDPSNEVESKDQQILPDGSMLIESVKAMLPPSLIDKLIHNEKTQKSSGTGAGQVRSGNRKGRPVPSRSGRINSSVRVDLIATLRAAAPWQPLRQKQQPNRAGLLIRTSDIRLKRYAEQSDRLLIFCVDASGSAAVSRLGEAKGAVELLLAEAYASRDHVALIAFRGTEAEVLLPPTRSLVQTKRRLSALPGGGGTPLASGLQNSLILAQKSQAKGLTPTIILMTDGRANIALDGSPNRLQAGIDAEKMARVLRSSRITSLVIDMSNRPQPALQELGNILGAPYVPLPRANAERLTAAVTSALAS